MKEKSAKQNLVRIYFKITKLYTQILCKAGYDVKIPNNIHSTIKIITVPSAALDINGSSNLTSCRTDARCFFTCSIITEALDPSQHFIS